ncbi:hypothetical protein VTO42DRAFT_870 [Malbranchea cinnamomea]
MRRRQFNSSTTEVCSTYSGRLFRSCGQPCNLPSSTIVRLYSMVPFEQWRETASILTRSFRGPIPTPRLSESAANIFPLHLPLAISPVSQFITMYSKNLIQWTLIGHALTRKSQFDIRTPEPGGGVWAPTIRFHNGEFYVTTANYDRCRPQLDDHSISWSDPVYFDQVGFDQDLFWDDDGTFCLSTTHQKHRRTPGNKLKDFAINVCTVDLETGNSTSPPVLLRESPSGIAEGSHILKRGKYYYLITAEGGTESGHCQWVSRSETGPFGPWELGKNNPLWRNGVEDEVQNTGHADLVEDAQGRWWGVFLGVRPVKTPDGWQSSVLVRDPYSMEDRKSHSGVMPQAYIKCNNRHHGLMTFQDRRCSLVGIERVRPYASAAY